MKIKSKKEEKCQTEFGAVTHRKSSRQQRALPSPSNPHPSKNSKHIEK